MATFYQTNVAVNATLKKIILFFIKYFYVTHFNLLDFDFLMVKIKKIKGILLCTAAKT